jgi:23S rRNA pseudouridine1911/1915/1917 synthase
MVNMKITVKKPTTLIEFLTEQYPATPRTRIKKLLQHGNVRCDNKTVKLHSYELSAEMWLKLTRKAGPR